MKPPLIIALLLVAGYPQSHAQTAEVDSLVRDLEHYQVHDSVRAQRLLDIAMKLRRVNPSEAKKYYEASMEVAVTANEPGIQTKANNGLAICYGMMGDYPLAIEHFHKTISLGRKHKDLVRVADGYNGLGIVYKRLGDYPQSLVYYTEALATYDSIQDEMGLGAANENVGVLYDLMKEPEKSMAYYQRAIDIYMKAQKPLSVSMARSNVAVLYVGQKRYDEALAIFRQNLKTYDSMGRHANSINAGVDIGHVYRLQGRHAEAREILLKSLEKAREFSMKQEQADIYHNLFEIAMAEGQPGQALSHAREYQRLAEQLGSKKFIASAYSILSRAHEKLGDHRSALEAFRQHKAWSDSVFNEDNARAFKAQEVKVEVLEKNKQLAEQQLRLEFLQEQVVQEARLKWLMVAAAVLLLATVVLFYQKFAERRRVNELLTAKNEEISRQKAHIEEINFQLENRMLRAQINPHFIFNSLSSIQHFIITDDRGAALKYLSKFSHLLRQVLESSITGNVVMKEELKLLSMYLELEALRFDHDFTYAIHVDAALNEDLIEIPTMILQPLIENAILHGLMPKSGDRKLDISFSANDGMMEIRIEDNGIGREASQAIQQGKRKLSPSRGLSVTGQRLASLREKYGWQSELAYVDLVGADGTAAGTCVVLRLPILEIS